MSSDGPLLDGAAVLQEAGLGETTALMLVAVLICGAAHAQRGYLEHLTVPEALQRAVREVADEIVPEMLEASPRWP